MNKNHDKLGRFAEGHGSAALAAGLSKVHSRKALDSAGSLAELKDSFETLVNDSGWKHVEVKLPTKGTSGPLVEHVRGAMQAFADLREKYPSLKVAELDFTGTNGGLGEGTYAATYYSGGILAREAGLRSNTRTIKFNQEILSESDLNETFESDGYHFPNGGKSAGYGIMVHELGHSLAGGVEPPVEKYLAEYYQKTRPGRTRQDFGEWLSHNMSGYSFEGTYVNPPEAFADGFADVELNGEHARETSKVLHTMIGQMKYGSEYVPGSKLPDMRPAVDPPPIQPGKGSGSNAQVGATASRFVQDWGVLK